jgi:RHS repeat-associated protein
VIAVGISNSRIFGERFPGQYSLNESGLYYNDFRDYDPQTGRYIEGDPLGLAGGINTYAYVEDSPLQEMDPHGLCGSKKCVGSARVLKGNRRLIGKPGAFPGTLVAKKHRGRNSRTIRNDDRSAQTLHQSDIGSYQ